MTKKQIKQKLKRIGINVKRLEKISDWHLGERYFGTSIFKRYMIYIKDEEIETVYQNKGNKRIKVWGSTEQYL